MDTDQRLTVVGGCVFFGLVILVPIWMLWTQKDTSPKPPSHQVETYTAYPWASSSTDKNKYEPDPNTPPPYIFEAGYEIRLEEEWHRQRADAIGRGRYDLIPPPPDPEKEWAKEWQRRQELSQKQLREAKPYSPEHKSWWQRLVGR